MRKLVFALITFLAISLLGGAAFTLPPAGLQTPSSQSLIQQVQRCERGHYFCPGKISGCCRIGWTCGETRCIAPKRRVEPVRYGNCYWDGTRPFCAGSCRSGFVRLKREGSGCVTGSRAYCCEPMGSISQY